MNPLTAAWNWLKAHPRLRAAIVLVLVFMLGFGSAFYAHPAKVVEKEKIVEHTKVQIQYQDRIVEKKVYVQVEKKHEHTETVQTKKPDGTVVTLTKQDADTNTGTNETTDSTATHTLTEVKYVDRIVEKEKLVLRQPDWRVMVGVGYAFATLAGQPEIGLPSMHGLVVQAGADRRILGPVFVGVSLNTQGTAFVNLSAVF
jgi:hypothetical protein